MSESATHLVKLAGTDFEGYKTIFMLNTIEDERSTAH